MKVNSKILLFFTLIIISSCSGDKRTIPDISDNEVKMTFHHFYKLFPGEPGYFKDDSIISYSKKYPLFFELFTRYVISIGGPEKKDFLYLANAFCSDPMIRRTYSDCGKIHEDLNDTEAGIKQAFTFYNYYFPEKIIPDIYFYISGFNQSLVIDSNVLGIALDKYLGENYDFYNKLGLPQYQRKRMIPEMMITDAIRAWLETDYVLPDSSETLLNSMIYNGKIQYLLEHILPYNHDTLLFAFSEEQLNWCENNEKKMWAWYIENKKLFETNPMEIKRFTADGPFTTQFSKESPARTGVWTGWRIVKRYMERNSGTTIADLMKENDGQKILSLSGYNP